MDRKGIVRRLGGAGEFARQWASILAQHPAVRLIAGAAARAAAGFLLARAVIFGEYAPFGAAFSAARLLPPARNPTKAGCAICSNGTAAK